MDVEIPLPQKLIDIANLLRSSGRTFWPAFYVIALGAVCVLVFARRSPRYLTVLLGVAALLQVVDSGAGWLPKRAMFSVAGNGGEWETPMRSQFWELAAQRYEKVRGVPVQRWGDHWKPLTYYAGQHDMGTDLARLSRIDVRAMDRAARRAMQTVTTGQFEADSLYILDEDAARIAAKTMRPGDLLRNIDGFNVLAPGFCVQGPPDLCAGAGASRDLSY